MPDEVLRQFARFRRRHSLVRGLDLFLEYGFLLTVTAAVVLLTDRLAFELGLAFPRLSSPAMLWVTLGAPLVLAAVAAALRVAARPAPRAQIAWRVDRASGGEERFLSALELATEGSGGVFAPALCRDAVLVAERIQPAQVLPRMPVGYRWGIVLALSVGALLYVVPPQLYDAPLADFDASTLRGPAPLDVFFSDGSIGAIDEFNWDFGDGASDSGERARHVYEKPGRYRARLSLRGPGGTSEKVKEIEVLSPDRAAADFQAQPLKGAGPLTVRFENLSRNAKSFQWAFGDGTESPEEAPVHVYEKPGLYAVRLTATNDVGKDEKIREKYIKVIHGDEPLADFRADKREGEAPLEVYFEDKSWGDITERRWDFGDVRSGQDSLSTERNPTHTFKAPGHYTIRLRVKGPHGEDEEEKVRYILVKNPGNNSGGGRGGQKNNSPTPLPKTPSGAGTKEGRLEGEKSVLPPYKTTPTFVTSQVTGTDTKMTDVNVYAPPPNAPGQPQDTPLAPVYQQYKRAAEDTIEKERIPPAMRDYVRRYYESLRPK
jgi:PKD repeat protein